MEVSIFFIITSNRDIYFKNEYISLSSNSNKTINIIKQELFKVKEFGSDLMEIKIYENFNIYLYKFIIKINSINEEVFIKINFLDKVLISEFPLEFKSNKSVYFIYEIKYKCEDILPIEIKILDGNIKDIKDFINNKFEINKLQKFLIFKKYLELHENLNYIDNLLENTKNEIINSKDKIDYEFLLSFLITLFGNKTKFSDVPENLKSCFKLTISNFINIKEVNIKNYYNKEYNKKIKVLENYKNDLIEEKSLLNLDLIILLFYQTNNRKEFVNFFEKIKYNKKDIVEYIIKHSNIFKQYNCSELELFYTNADDKEIGRISSLSSNFNEYISFICLNIEKIKDKNLYQNINLKNCPSIIIMKN